MKTLNEIRDELADSLAMDFYPMCSQANDRTNVRYIVKSSCDKIVKAHAELVKGLVGALDKANAFNIYMLNHFISLQVDWKNTKYAAEHIKISHVIEDALADYKRLKGEK